MSIIEKIKSYVTGASIAGVAYTPKTEYKGSLPKSTVRSGSKGADVTAVQTFLNWGIGAGLVVDAIAGPKTVAAVKAFQKQSKITADGIFGSNTKTQAQALINKHKKKPTPPKKIYKVIDVSEFQDSINWTKAKVDGVQGVIVRCGFRGAETGKLKTDSMFLNHIKGAHKAGIPVGIYMFTEAVNAKEGKEEADYAIKLWQTAGIPVSFPIAVDTENVFYKEGGKTLPGRANSSKLSTAKRTEAIKGFCDQIIAKGYRPMIYASVSWLNNQLNMSKLPYDVWVAQYNDTCQYKGKCVIWQYSSSGKVDGIRGNVDMNKCYIDPKKVNPPKAAEKKGYTGKLPTYKLTKTNAQVIADAIKWAKWIAKDNDFHYGYGRHAHHNGCYFCGTQYQKKNHGIKMYEHTYCCNAFVGAAWAHGGGDATALKMCQNCDSWDFGTGSDSYDKSPLFNKVVLSKIKPGDVLCSNSHAALYIGDGKVIQATGGDDNVIRSKVWNDSIAVGSWGGYKRAYRYNGSVNVNRPLRKGEVSDRILYLKKFLIWYGFNLDANCIFSENTEKAVRIFQEKEMGKKEADGIVGPKTIEAMKAVKK